NIPTDSATDSFDAVGGHRFAITRAAKNHAALGLTIRHCFGDWTNEERIIDRLFRVGSKVRDLVSQIIEELLDLLLISESGMIGPDSDFHLVISSFAIISRETR